MVDWEDGSGGGIDDSWFSNYVRRSVFYQFKMEYEADLAELEEKVKDEIERLRKRGVLDYPSAVEL